MRSLSVVLLACAALWFCAAFSFATDVSGPVQGVWTPGGNPYHVVGEITLPAYQTLLIQPGVQVIFQGHYKFIVYGMLEAIGTPEASIIITAADTATGFWGIRFYDLSTQTDSSRLAYCHISYGISTDQNGGTISGSNSNKLLISHCLICNNKTADVVGTAGQNGQGGIYSGNPGGPGGNASSRDGGAIFLSNSNSLIVGNTFYMNSTGMAAGGPGGNGQSLVDHGAEISGGFGGVGGSATSGKGGVIYCDNSMPLVLDNIFQANCTGNAVGGQGGNGGTATSTDASGAQAVGGYGGNAGSGTSGGGGAIYFNFSRIVLRNCIFVANAIGTGTGGYGGNGGNSYCSIDPFPVEDRGGNGGNGADGWGGSGAAIYTNSQYNFINNLTTTENHLGLVIAGHGGSGGRGDGSPGWPGLAGNAHPGFGILYYTSSNGSAIANSIVYERPLIFEPHLTHNYLA